MRFWLFLLAFGAVSGWGWSASRADTPLISMNGAFQQSATGKPNAFMSPLGIGTSSPAAWAMLDVSGTSKINLAHATASASSSSSSTVRNSWVDSSLSVTAPQSGTYLVMGSGRLWTLAASDGWWILRVYNATQAAVIYVGFGAGYTTGGSSVAQGDISVPFTSLAKLSAGDTIKLQYQLSGSGTDPFHFNADSNGQSALHILRIGD